MLIHNICCVDILGKAQTVLQRLKFNPKCETQVHSVQTTPSAGHDHQQFVLGRDIMLYPQCETNELSRRNL